MILRYRPGGLLPVNKQCRKRRGHYPKVVPLSLRGSGIKHGSPALSGLELETILGASGQIPSKENRTPAAASEDPEVPDMLTDMLRRVSVSEENRALMVTVVEKILSAKSGLNEAFMSLLRGFEVCDVVLPIE